MADAAEWSSGLSFTSSYVSNGTSPDAAPPPPAAEPTPSLEVVSLTRLSCNLESLLLTDADFNCSDADIIVESAPVGVHRCILSARSKFFHDLFARDAKACAEGAAKKVKRPQYKMSDLVPCGHVGTEAFMLFLSYVYTGKLKPYPPEVSQCVDDMCAHDACRPAVNFVVELMYASSVFQISELVSLFQRRLITFVEKACVARVEDIIPILLVAFHSQLNQLLSDCIQRIARSNLDSVSLDKELPPEVAAEIKALRKKSQAIELDVSIVDPIHEKRVTRIHRALDSDDVALVKLLLTESDVTLDDANALHYAAMYCDSKIAAEILELDLANVNLKNARGYTPLHVAAMRREPAVIMSLLDKDASALETTDDGQNAVSICRRLTRAKDYYAKREKGQETNKDWLCIDVLEREMMRNPISVEDSVTSPYLADDLHMKLLYLENRVAFARLFFPTEAKLAMHMAHAEKTSEFAGLTASRSSANLREVDLNETPIIQNKRLRPRVDALARTVELGRRYFPNCSEVLDKFLEDDQPDLYYLQKGTPDEQKMKKMRFTELKTDFQKAFTKDKTDFQKAFTKDNAVSGRSGLSSSSSSTSSLKRELKQNIVKKRTLKASDTVRVPNVCLLDME